MQRKRRKRPTAPRRFSKDPHFRKPNAPSPLRRGFCVSRKGIGAALDAAFESVAFASGDVLDPETGKLAVGEGEVVRVAAEAATARFAGLSTDQVFGAVSVATVRASNSGLLDALGNDPVLNSMSMSEQELEQTLEYMKAGSKNAIMYTIDQLAKVSSPAFKNMILPLIKAMVGDMFDGLFPKSSVNSAS